MTRVHSKSSLFWGNPANWLAIAAAGFCAWKIWGSSARAAGNVVFPIEQGKDYEFVLEAHPYGDEASWWSEVEDALASSGAHSLELVSRGQGSVVLKFVKTSPVTTSLPARTVLYPSDAPLATATLLDAKAASSSGVLPLGTSA
jgi:hypothetical protein